MRLEWTANAKRDLREIIAYIWIDNPLAARRMNGRFQAAAKLLIQSPYSGKPGMLPDTRELIVHPNYRLVYQIKGEIIAVMAIIHTARQWPPVHDS